MFEHIVRRQLARRAGWAALRKQGVLGRYLAGRLLIATGLWRFVVLKRRGFALKLYPSSMSISEWTSPGERHGEEDFFRSYLRPGDWVVDVGANVGTVTLVASLAVGPSGKVIALEPHPRTYGFLLGNLKLNGVTNVVSRNAAVGDRPGEIWLTSSVSDDQNSVTGEGQGVRVSQVTLDDVVAANAQIALLKIDVEGYERFVLAGAVKTLSRTACVYFESWDQAFRRFGYDSREIANLLRDAGFRIFRFTPEGNIKDFGVDDSSPVCENLLAVRDSESFPGRLLLER
jgi:FkbM family methyltransferase